MGTLVYDDDRRAEFDDRTLAHLQVIVVNKLRRRENFAFTWSDDLRTVTIWISPNTPLEFIYQDNRRPRLNRGWLEELALMASSVGGLVVVPEPPADDPTAVGVPVGLPADRTGTGSPRAGSWRQAPT